MFETKMTSWNLAGYEKLKIFRHAWFETTKYFILFLKRAFLYFKLRKLSIMISAEISAVTKLIID